MTHLFINVFLVDGGGIPAEHNLGRIGMAVQLVHFLVGGRTERQRSVVFWLFVHDCVTVSDIYNTAIVILSEERTHNSVSGMILLREGKQQPHIAK